MSEAHPRVKICGITRLQDAELAVELGAWAIGMVFYEPSPRRCSLLEAGRIAAALRRKVELCGVFVNAPLEQVTATSEELGLTMLQLHGDEGPAFCAEAARRTGARVTKAMQVIGPGDVQDVERFHVDYHLLDARSSAPEDQGLRGGTGEIFDWTLLTGRRSGVPLILSGGLRPENVACAIAATHPFAVDTASGTEIVAGRKDPARLRAFFAAVAGTARTGEARTGVAGTGRTGVAGIARTGVAGTAQTDEAGTGREVEAGIARGGVAGTEPAGEADAMAQDGASEAGVLGSLPPEGAPA